MTAAEAIMWAVEKDPALRSDFCNLTILDRVPDEARLRRKVREALAAMPRLGERVVSPPLRIAPPEWRPDPTLDLDYHLRHVALPAPGTTRTLLDLVAGISAPPLDRSRPLWEFTVIEGLEGGRAALLQKVHHTITDGVGGLKLSLSLVDLERDVDRHAVLTDEGRTGDAHDDRPEDHDEHDDPLSVVRDAVGDAVGTNLGRLRDGVAAGVDVLTHPADVPRHAAEAWRLLASARRQLLVTEPGHSPLFRSRSLARRFDVLTVPAEPALRAASMLAGTLNDLYVTAVAGALGRYHERFGVVVPELRLAMPVSTRGEQDAAANRFAPTRVLVPTEPKEPAARFRATHERLAAVRGEPALAAADSLTALVAGLPTSLLVAATRAQTRTIDFAASNLRGSPVPLYLAGARIEASYPMGPRTGTPLNVTLLSYCDDLCIGVNSDPAAVTDPDAFMELLGESFDALLVAGA